jgi:hypothetical protein
MNRRTRILSAATGLIAALMLTGCASSLQNVAAIDADEATVFGKLRLVRNDEHVDLGGGMFGNTASFRIASDALDKEFVGQVGEGGDFAWALEPGSYYLTAIDFHNKGERVSAPARLRFTVAEDASAVYIGTITLYTRFFTGYHGIDGRLSHSIRNECSRDCNGRLESLGFDDAELTVALLRVK